MAGGVDRLRGARSELRRQLREQRRVRSIALVMVVLLVLGAPMIYFGILFATRDPVLNSLDRLEVPRWAAQSPEDRVIGGSRWCFIDCRFRERTLLSERDASETTEVYQEALLSAGWTQWDVEGCPLVPVDGDYTCWTRDEYTLDLWVRPPDCAYDPRNRRPDPEPGDEANEQGEAGQEDNADEAAEGDQGEGDQDEGDQGEGDQDEGDQEDLAGDADACQGSVVEIKMQNRVADERGLPGPGGELPGPGGELPEPTTSPPPVSPPPTTTP